MTKTPKEFLSAVKSDESKGRTDWFGKLRNEQRAFVGDVVREIAYDPSVSLTAVATGLIREMGLKVSQKTVRMTLSELIKEVLLEN